MLYIACIMLGAILGAFAMCLFRSQPPEVRCYIWDGDHVMGCDEAAFRSLVDGVKR